MGEATTTTLSRLQTLPSLDKSKASVPVLARKINRPVRMPKAIDAWNRLQRIEYIDVVPVAGESTDEVKYSVNIFLRHNENHIPVNHLRVHESTSLLASPSPLSASSPRPGTSPDLQVLHTFSELDTLRHEIWTSIRQYHPVYCELCSGLSLQMVTKLCQPAIFTATIHRSQSKRAKKMQSFLMHVLTELYEKKSFCVAVCKGQNELPMLLHNFLFETEEASTTTA